MIEQRTKSVTTSWAKSRPRSSGCSTTRPGYILANRSTWSGIPRMPTTAVPSGSRMATSIRWAIFPEDGFVVGPVDRQRINPPGRLRAAGLLRNIRRANRCPVNLMVFQCEKGRRLLEKAEPTNELEALHQTVLQAYQNAQQLP